MLGTAKIDITPQFPIHLAGFSNRLGLSQGVSNHIYSRIWYLRYYSNASNYSDALFIQGDLIWWGDDFTGYMFSKLSSRFGIAPDAIIFHAEHNHSGPQTCNNLSPLLGIYDADYIKTLPPKIIEGVHKALTNLEPVTIERGSGNCDIGINRRKAVNGIVEMLPNLGGPVDPEITVIRFRTSLNKIKGIFFHYTCHATTTDNNMISSEYGGVAEELIEKYYGENTTASFCFSSHTEDIITYNCKAIMHEANML